MFFAHESEVIQALVISKVRGEASSNTSFPTWKSPFPRSPIALLHGHVSASKEGRGLETLPALLHLSIYWDVLLWCEVHWPERGHLVTSSSRRAGKCHCHLGKPLPSLRLGKEGQKGQWGWGTVVSAATHPWALTYLCSPFLHTQNTLPCIPQGNQLQDPSQFLHLAPNPGSQTKQHSLQQIWMRFFMISQPTN